MIPKGHYHFTGVAGVGMSAIAQVVLAQGNQVTGSDRDNDAGKYLEVIRKLKAVGVRFVPQNGSGIRNDTAGVIVSTAIEQDNPDLLSAGRLKVPLIHRADMLARLVEGNSCIAVTGTSGKSTVTGMIGWILDAVGADPVVVNGAPVLNWCDDSHIGNMRCGASHLWVIEADESDKSLLCYHPDWAVITNVSRDHFDLPETMGLFEKFSAQVKKEIVSIISQPDLFRDFNPQVSAEGSSFVYKGTEFVVPLPGRHNAENALYAVIICEKLGHSPGCIRSALKSFMGIQRRLEKVGEAGGVTVIDDYGHNPAKIRAAWLAVSQVHRRVIGIWRPHGYRPLASMMDELSFVFSEVCRAGDSLYILPVYDAGGTADRRTNSENLVRVLKDRKLDVNYIEDIHELARDVSRRVSHGDAVITMGARDPYLPELAREILEAIRSNCQLSRDVCAGDS